MSAPTVAPGGTSTPPSTHPSTGLDRRVLGGVAVLLVVGWLLPVLLASHFGALGIPRSDDWSYLLTLFRWVDHGRIDFNDWVSMTLIGQLVVAAPVVAVVGRSVWAVQVLAAVIGWAGLVALYLLGRRFLPDGKGALFLPIVVALGPLWAPLVTTYMTDVPAFAAQMVALALAARAFRTRPVANGWLAGALAVAFVGFSIRQYGAVPVVAILVAALWAAVSDRDRRQVRIVVGMGVLLAVGAAVVLLWWVQVPHPLSLSPEMPSRGSLVSVGMEGAGFLRLAGLLLSPVLVLAGPVRLVRRAWAASRGATVVLGGGASLMLLATYARRTSVPFVGNYVDRFGVLANDVMRGNRSLVMPARVFDVLVAVGMLGALLLVLAAVPALVALWSRCRARDLALRDPLLAAVFLCLVGYAIAYGAAVALVMPIFDRYALPAIPLVGLLALRAVAVPVPAVEPARARVEPRRVAPVLAVAVLAFVGLAFAADSASFDATRWHVATAATHRGYDPLQVDGGFEWVAYHRHRGPALGDTVAERQRLRAIYFRGLCVTVVVNPSPNATRHAIATGEVQGLLHAPAKVVAYRNDRACD